MLKEWKIKWPGFDIDSVSWPKSIHAAHLREHKEELVDTISEIEDTQSEIRNTILEIVDKNHK